MFQVSKILKEQTDLMGVIYRDDKYVLTEMPNITGIHAIGIRNRNDGRFCRISIFEPKYIGAEGEDYELTEEEIKEIIPIIKQNWRSILENMNDQFIYDEEVKHINEDMEMPDYLGLLKGERIL